MVPEWSTEWSTLGMDFPMVHDQSAKIHPKTLQKLACHAEVDAIQIEKCGAGCLATLCGQGRLRRSSPLKERSSKRDPSIFPGVPNKLASPIAGTLLALGNSGSD